MAKVIESEYNTVAKPWWAQIKMVWLGASAGLSWWVVSTLLNRYVVEPFACRDLATVQTCVNSFGTSGSIAAIIIAVGFTYVLVRNLQPRPIIIAAATLVLLWDLGTLMSGLSWWVSLLWAVLLYVVSYLLFALVACMRMLWLSGLTALFIVVAIRLILLL